MTATLPLFCWKDAHDLECERAMLVERLEKLPRFSHARIELEFRLRQITNKAIEAECGVRP
jgi:hypothetical protein